MTTQTKQRAWLPPRWVVRLAWAIHRGWYRVTGGRRGLGRPKKRGWGTARLTTVGRRSGEQRSVMIGYFEDGPDIVTLAMNGWADAEPAWWLNLQAQPEATLELIDGRRTVRGRAAQGDERSRLWEKWGQIDDKLEGYAARRSRETAVVILEPSPTDAA